MRRRGHLSTHATELYLKFVSTLRMLVEVGMFAQSWTRLLKSGGREVPIYRCRSGFDCFNGNDRQL